MDYASIPLFSLMKTKLDYLSQRQAVLAQNVANVDTPGYKARDLKAPNFKRLVSEASGPLHLAVTDPGHITKGAVTGTYKMIHRDKTNELNPTGNNVNVEEELSNVAQNQAEYQKMLNLYSKAISMFKIAVGNPNA